METLLGLYQQSALTIIEGGVRQLALGGPVDSDVLQGIVAALPGRIRGARVNGSDRPAGVDASAGNGVLVGDHGTQQNFFVEQRAAAVVPVALAQLPPLAAGFTGRQAELAQVAKLLDPSGETGTVVVSAVAGLAGVGKTTLARRRGRCCPAPG